MMFSGSGSLPPNSCDSPTRWEPVPRFRLHPTSFAPPNQSPVCRCPTSSAPVFLPARAPGSATRARRPRRATGTDAPSFSVGGPPIPVGGAPVALAQADAEGPAVDAVYVPPGRVAYVRATGLSGGNARAGVRYLVADTGVRFAVHDDDATHDLGLAPSMIAAPWPVLAVLPAGPDFEQIQCVTRTGCSGRRSTGWPAVAGCDRADCQHPE